MSGLLLYAKRQSRYSKNWILQDELPFETKPANDSLAMKIFSDTCCHGCYCQSEKDHQQESI